MFSQHGYEGVGVREIAREVGVNPSLVIRYFGSKQGLFAASVEQMFSAADWSCADRAVFGRQLAEGVMRDQRSDAAFDGRALLLRSLGQPEAAAILREALDRQLVVPLAGWLGGTNAPERAGTIVSLLMGATVLRQVFGSPSLAGTETSPVVTVLGEAIQRLIDQAEDR